MADRIAWELTADPVPIERAFERVAVASAKASNESEQAWKEAQKQVTVLEARLAQLGKAYANTNNAESQKRLTVAMQATQKAIDGAKVKAQELNTAITNTGKAIKQTSKETSFFSDQLKNIGGLVAGAFAIGSIIQFGKAVVQVTTEMDSLNRQMKAVTGSEELASAEMQFLKVKSEELGLELISTSKAYISFAGAATKSGLTLAQTRDIFTSVAEAGTVMGLSSEQVQGTFLALSQMASKGVLSMEELRQQLGERIPGSFALSVKAAREMTGNMNLTEKEFNKMVEQGQILSKDFLPALAKEFHNTFGADAQEAANGMTAETNRLTNAWTDLKLSLGDSAPIATSIKGLTLMVQGLDNALTTLSFALASVKMVGGDVGAMAELTAKMQKSALDKYRAEKAVEAQLYANNILQGISNEKAEEQQKILMRRVATLEGARVTGNNLSEDEVKNNIELTEKAKALYDIAIGLKDTKKGEIKLTEAQTKALERQRKEIEKGQEALRKWLMDRDARVKELTAGAEIPDYAKNMGTDPNEERAKQAIKELENEKLFNETLFNQESKLLEDQRAYELINESEYLEKKLALYQQYGKDAGEVQLAIFQNEKKLQEEALRLSVEKLQATAGIALELSGLYTNALERQQIDLDESRKNGLITEEQYQMKLRQIKRKEFEVNRIAAIAEIGIRTAVNATSSALNPVLLPYVIGLGVAQALVAATKPNPYAKGTKRVKGGQLGMDSVPFIDGDGSNALLMPGEMIVPRKKTAEHAPYLDNMFDGRISPTQSRWASGLFVNQSIDPGLIRYMMSITGQPQPRNTGVDKLAKAILKKRNPDFNRPADKIVRAIYDTANTTNSWRKFKR